jgi:hypothetical protein
VIVALGDADWPGEAGTLALVLSFDPPATCCRCRQPRSIVFTQEDQPLDPEILYCPLCLGINAYREYGSRRIVELATGL